MLGFIKKYRNSPKRTVLTMKCKKSLYILKQGDIKCPTKRVSKPKEMKNFNSQETVIERNIGGFYNDNTRHSDKTFCTENNNDKDTIYAFNLHDDFCSMDEVFENDGCCETLENQYKPDKNIKQKTEYKRAETSLRERKLFEKSTKGAYVCEKTYRVLLCDVIAVLSATWAVICLIKVIFKKK